MHCFIWILSAVFIYQSSSQCLQRGCDQAGLFYQDIKLDMLTSSSHSLLWSSSEMSTQTYNMSMKSDLFGCVANTELVVCPYYPESEQHPVLAVFEVENGRLVAYLKELENPGVPVITNYSTIIATNNTYVALYSPIHRHSEIHELPYKNKYGTLSPILLRNNMVLIVGNFSTEFSVWKYTKDYYGLRMLSHFNLTSAGMAGCGWLPAHDLAARGNRLYFFGQNTNYAAQNPGGLVAFDILSNGSSKLAWVINADESYDNKSVGVCNYTLPVSDGIDYLAPVDIATQMLVTPEGLIMITSGIGLLKIWDRGNHGESLYTYWGGEHFMSYTPPRTGEKEGMVWMNGWNLFPGFKESVLGVNSTVFGEAGMVVLDLLKPLNVKSLNITSQLTSFKHPTDREKRPSETVCMEE